MTDKIDDWLFEHAQVQGHPCSGIKNESGENIAWHDDITGEVIYMDGAEQEGEG